MTRAPAIRFAGLSKRFPGITALSGVSVDVASGSELHGWIDQLTASGVAIRLISSELPELLHLSTRVLVLREGQLVGEYSRAEATPSAVLRLMLGGPRPAG